MNRKTLKMKQYYLLALSAILSIAASEKSFSQDFYDINTIQTIEIEFAQSNWDAILDAEKAGDNNYTEALSVTLNGEVFETVGVKFKGNSSYNPNFDKNPFHIELDTYVSQDYQGYKDIKLANVYFDPSFVRETISYNIAGQYMDAPQANYANVYVNGVLIGLYSNTEAITKTFVDSKFGSKTNAFFSCSPPDGAGPGSNDFPNLEYLGTDISNYEDAYEIKSDDESDPTVAIEHWNELINLADVLNNDISNIETVLDVDRALWMLAFDNVLVNLDSYIGQFKQNWYLYKTDSNVFNSVVWDLNMSFGTFAQTGQGPPLNSTTEKAQLDHLLHDTSSDFPLFSKLMTIPRYKKMYLAHYKTILTENITNSNYLTLANDYQNLVDAAVQADVNKFYTYAQFIGNINTDYNLGMNTAPGLANLMNARGSYLSGLSDFTVTQPTISNVASSSSDPDVGDTVTFTTTVTNSNAVILGYRTDQHAPFTKIEMFDDGAHNDGAAGDNVFGIDLTITNDYTHYYVYAENNDIGAFSPARAQHEFYTLIASYIPLSVGDLVINELMADNESVVADQDGEFDDWIELYNNSNETLNLDGIYLSDDPTDLLQWEFPDGLTLAPDNYLIIWCDKDLEQDGLHADIKFSASGESAILSYAGGTVIEDIEFGEQETDLSYSRIPNGTGDFIIKQATFGINNEIILSVDSFDSELSLNYYPNPTKDILNIENAASKITSVQISSILGQVLFSEAYNNSSLVELDLSAFTTGTYFVSVNENTVIKVLKN